MAYQQKNKNDIPQQDGDRRKRTLKLFDRMTLTWRLMFDRRVSLFHKMIPVAIVAYILSPIDFMPELFFGPFGVVDDIGIFMIGLGKFINMAPYEVVEEHVYELRHRRKRKRGYDDENIIEGQYTVEDDY